MNARSPLALSLCSVVLVSCGGGGGGGGTPPPPLNEAPTITVARTGNNVTLQWPASATGYILESATAPAGTWTAAGLSVSVVDGLSTATTSAADDVRLYRLRKP